MPPRPPLDDNTRFLWQCLLSSDFKNIDFPSVARAFALNTPAARMRYTRLKRQLEAEEAEEARLAGYPVPAVNQPVIRRRKKRKAGDEDEDSCGVKKERGAKAKVEAEGGEEEGEKGEGEEEGGWKRVKVEAREEEREGGGGGYESEEEAMLKKRKVMMQIKEEEGLDDAEW